MKKNEHIHNSISKTSTVRNFGAALPSFLPCESFDQLKTENSQQLQRRRFHWIEMLVDYCPPAAATLHQAKIQTFKSNQGHNHTRAPEFRNKIRRRRREEKGRRGTKPIIFSDSLPAQFSENFGIKTKIHGKTRPEAQKNLILGLKLF